MRLNDFEGTFAVGYTCSIRVGLFRIVFNRTRLVRVIADIHVFVSLPITFWVFTQANFSISFSTVIVSVNVSIFGKAKLGS